MIVSVSGIASKTKTYVICFLIPTFITCRTEEEIGEKGDFVGYPVPPLEDWISGKWKHPDDSEMQE